MCWFHQQLSCIPTQLSCNCDQTLKSVHGCVGFSNELSRIATQFLAIVQTVLARMPKFVLVSTIVLHCTTKQPPCTGTNALFLALVLVPLSVSMSLQKLPAFGAVKNAARDELLSGNEN